MCQNMLIKSVSVVRYKATEDARKAIQSLNGLELAGREIKVGPVAPIAAENTGSQTQAPDGEVRCPSRFCAVFHQVRDETIFVAA